MHVIVMRSQREALFNSPDLGDLKGGAAPFFDILLAHADRITVAQDRGLAAPGPNEMTLISATYVDQPVRTQARRLGL